MKKRGRGTHIVRARGVRSAEADVEAILGVLLRRALMGDPAKHHPADDVEIPETQEGFESPPPR